MPPFAPPKVSNMALSFSGAPSEMNSEARVASRNWYMNDGISKPNAYPVVLWYGGSTYTTESLGTGLWRSVIISMWRQVTPFIPFAKISIRRRNSIGEGCIGLAGLRRTLVAVGSQ